MILGQLIVQVNLQMVPNLVIFARFCPLLVGFDF
jgi:hypothetical protein